MLKKLSKWIWGSLGNIVQIATWLGATALSAWAIATVKAFGEYAPASWVLAGLLGGFTASLSYRLIAAGRRSWIKTKYDNAMMARGGLVDPLASTFELKRIYLSEFCLPSHPHVVGKTFVDCEIVGPANILLVAGNAAIDNRPPSCDAIPLKQGETPYNGIFFENCTFRRCSFQRITFLISHDEYDQVINNNLLHWIGNAPAGIQMNLPMPLEEPDDQAPLD